MVCKRKSRLGMPASLPGVTAEERPDGTLVEKDKSGRVVKARFAGGSLARYSYNDLGELDSFVYAGLVWNTSDGAVWAAWDGNCEYRLEARVSVEPDATLCIQKKELVRRIQLNGSREDHYFDGSGVNSCPQLREAAATDLLPLVLPFAEASSAGQAGPEGPKPGEPTLETLRKMHEQEIASRATVQAAGRGSRTERLRAMGREDARMEQRSLPAALAGFLKEAYARAFLGAFGFLYRNAHPCLVVHLEFLAGVHHRRRQIDEAERLYRKAIKLRQDFMGPRHAGCAANLESLAGMALEQGRYTAAEQLLSAAVSIRHNDYRKEEFFVSAGISSPESVDCSLARLLLALNMLAQVFAEQGKFRQADKQFQIALAVWNAFAFPAGSYLEEVMRTVLHSYRQMLLNANKFAEAELLSARTKILIDDQVAVGKPA